MVLVAVVAILIWAATHLPRTIDQMIVYRQNAETYAVLGKQSKDEMQKALARARAFQADLDQWRREKRPTSPLTESYLSERAQAALVDVRHQRELVAYHVNLKDKYRRLRWLPWITVPRDPSPPPAPPPADLIARVPGKVNEFIYERGISINFQPNGKAVAVGRADHTIRFMDPRSGKELASLTVPDGDPRSIAFSPDGQTIAEGGDGRLVRLWDVATGHERLELPGSMGSPTGTYPRLTVTDVAFSPDGRSVAVAMSGEAVRPLPGQPSTPIFSIKLFDTRNGRLKWEHQGTGNWLHGIACSPDGGTLAYADGAATLLDMRTGGWRQTLKPIGGYVGDVAFSPNGRFLAGAGSDFFRQGGFGGEGRVTLWDLPTGSIVHTLKGPTGRAQQVAFSPDGRSVAAAGSGPPRAWRARVSGSKQGPLSSEVTLFDVATGRMIWNVEGESDAAFSLAFSPEGRSLGFCDNSNVYLVEITSGKLLMILMNSTITSDVGNRQPHPWKRETAKP
jgi:DNA-binding beta-propeller fold protein YncE